MTTGIIVQARMTSTRFPGKIMHPIDGRTVLDRVLDRARRVPGIDTVIVAYPKAEASAPIYQACKAAGIACFAGSEMNVLSRYYKAAQKYRLDVIMRITSDCPFFNPIIAGEVVTRFRMGDVDYASNVFPRRTFPKGFDCEVFSFDCLEAAFVKARNDYDREHVTPWMQQTDGILVANLTQDEDHSHINLCVDYPEDIARLEAMIASGQIPSIGKVEHATRH